MNVSSESTDTGSSAHNDERLVLEQALKERGLAATVPVLAATVPVF